MSYSDHFIDRLPILILYPHSRCNCRCVMCDIWKATTVEEVTLEELNRHSSDIEKLAVEWVVFSGGEPLMHSDLFRLADSLRLRGIRTTVLTTGLRLERDADKIIASIDDVIVSLDGPPATHDSIRRVRGAFEALERGVQALHRREAGYPVTGRCTVQSRNHSDLRGTVRTAKRLGLRSISFLAADLTSTAFNRPEGWPPERQASVGLSAAEIDALEGEVERLLEENEDDITNGFILEGPDKLRRIVQHFRAHQDQAELASPRCNAPWVSAVVEADGTVRPCFFHRPLGNLNQGGLFEVLNSPEAVAFRSNLDVARDPTCRRCVCSLYRPHPTAAERSA